MTRRPLPLLVVAAVSVWIAGCSGPQPSEEPVQPVTPAPQPEPSTARYELLAFDEQGLVRLDDGGTNRRVLEPEARPGGLVVSEGEAVAFTMHRGDSTYLARFDAESESVRHVHASGTDAAYSVAWAPDSLRFAFGYRTALGGDVLISTPDELVDPGCSASIVAAHWPGAERLVTGDGSSRYVVDPDDCTTLAAVDARKMHHVTYAPGRPAMAYVFRDLVYNRDARSYDPDSALFVAAIDGSNASELFDFAYRPRHLAWSPDGSTLAFDVRVQEPPNRRRIVLGDRSGDYSYLVAPDAFPEADVVRPVWSPSGRHVAFDLVRDGAVSKAVRSFGRTSVLASDADSTWGWIDDETIAFVDRDDSLKAVAVDGERRFTLGPGMHLLYARPISSTPHPGDRAE